MSPRAQPRTATTASLVLSAASQTSGAISYSLNCRALVDRWVCQSSVIYTSNRDNSRTSFRYRKNRQGTVNGQGLIDSGLFWVSQNPTSGPTYPVCGTNRS